MWPFSSKKRSRVAVFLHDGAMWHARVFAYGRKRWKSLAQMKIDGRNPRDLPDALLDFADEQGARRVRLLLPQNVQTLSMEIPPDIEPEELQAALGFEIGGEAGVGFDDVRVAVARAEPFRMGAPAGTLLAATFDEASLEVYEATCRAEGMAFDGVGALELAVLAVHTQRRPESRMLLLRRDAGMYATPGTETMPMTVGGIGLGVREDPREHDEQRRERTVRRFKLHETLPLSVWCSPMPDEFREEQLRGLIGQETEAEFLNLEAAIDDVARQATETAEVGLPAGGGALVGPRPPEQDPHRAGTWMFFLILLATLGGLGIYWQHLHSNLTILKEKIEAFKTIQQEKKSLEGKLARLKTERRGCEETVDILAEKNPLPANLIPLLDALDRSMPEFTRIEKIEPGAGGSFVVKGHTSIQPKLNDLYKGLLNDMGRLGGQVKPGEVSIGEDAVDYVFSYWIGPVPQRAAKLEKQPTESEDGEKPEAAEKTEEKP